MSFKITCQAKSTSPVLLNETYTSPVSCGLNKSFYYINTNEIPGEISRENLISSPVKISPLLWLHDKSRLSHQKNYVSEMVKYFIGVYIINRTLQGRLEIRNFSSRVQ